MRVLASLAFALAAFACERPPAITSVCELAEDGRTWDGRLVRIDAVFNSDFRHGSSLIDETCAVGGVDFEVEQSAEESVEAFLEVARAQWERDSLERPYDFPQQFRIRVTGRFSAATNEGREVARPPSSQIGLLRISELESLELGPPVFRSEADRLLDVCYLRAALGHELDVARTACDEYARLSEDSAWSMYLRGLVALRQNRDQAALDDFARCLGSREDANCLIGKGIAAIRLGSGEAGSTDIARAYELKPDLIDSIELRDLIPAGVSAPQTHTTPAH